MNIKREIFRQKLEDNAGMSITVFPVEIEIELTDQEIEDAYRERRRYYNMEDIKSKLDSMIEEYEGEPEEEKLKAILADDEKIRDLADAFDNALSENDYFMESFWITAENVIKDEMEE